MSAYRGTCSAPRWAGVSSAIKDAAFMTDLKLDIEIDKGWISENIRFTVTGEADKVKEFTGWFERAINEYNESKA